MWSEPAISVVSLLIRVLWRYQRAMKESSHTNVLTSRIGLPRKWTSHLMLELKGICAGYDTGQVLRQVDLVVPDNAVVALIGPNGAGKTTLLRVASGLLKPTSGSVLLDGEDVT